jgi:integrase
VEAEIRRRHRSEDRPTGDALSQLQGNEAQKLRASHLVELYAKLLERGGQDGAPLSAPTIRLAHRTLHRALGHAVTWGIIAANPAAVVKPPRAPDTEISIFTEEQIAAVLRHLEGRTLRTVVSFLLGTGCRRGEALALRWSDINDNGTVRIERSLEQTGGGLRFKSPKTKHGRRSIAISPFLVAELRAHRARQQERRLALGLGRIPDDGLVFCRWDEGSRCRRNG